MITFFKPRRSASPGHRSYAADSPDTFERERLALLTQMADPITTANLRPLGVGPGWRCLDVAAGDGSVARSLAGRVGPNGRVVATDVDTRFLVEHRRPNLEVRRHDILEDDLEPESYDLVHSRFLLTHLPDPLRALERMAAAVRPGGWLLVEEADFGLAGSADPWHPRAAGFDRTWRSVRDAVQATGQIDGSFGRRLPALVEGLGLREVEHEEATLIGQGGDPSARSCRMTYQIQRGRLIAEGAFTVRDFDELDRAFDDPSFRFIPFTVFGVWGRRAG